MAKAKKVEQSQQEAIDASVQAMVQQVIEETSVPEVKVDASGRKTSVDLTHEQLEEKGLKNKSQIIRFLDAEGYSRSAIANFLGVRYQHVRNVLVTPLKRTA